MANAIITVNGASNAWIEEIASRTGPLLMLSDVGIELPWFAVKVRTRSEALTASALRDKGYDCFYPTFRERRVYRDRKKIVESAIFPGYLFCRFDPENKLPILNTAGVNYIVGFGAELAPIAEAEIEAVRRAAAAGALPVPYLQVGQRVRIEHGSLAGVEGILTRACGASRIVVSIELLQRSIALTINQTEVRPADGNRQADGKTASFSGGRG